MGSTVCLNMIVKNEARTISRCLEAARPFIDSWVIIDTGSTDGTQALIRKLLADLPGELHERRWKNFGHNRSEAISLAEGKADFILLCDADMALTIHDRNWRPDPAYHAYWVRQHRTVRSFSNLRLVNGRLTGAHRWCYRGSTHEFIDSVRSELNTNLATTDAIAFWDYADGGSKADKYTRDAALLERELSDLEARAATWHPADLIAAPELGLDERELTNKMLERTVFYLAQTYRDMEAPANALPLYQRRAAMGGWEEEAWFALFQVAELSAALQMPQEVVVDRYLAAYSYRPRRAEPLVALARYHRLREDFPRAHLYARQAVALPEPDDDVLFIDRATYDWQALDEFAVASYWMGSYDDCRSSCERLLASGRLPESEMPRVRRNLELASTGQQQVRRAS